MYVYYCRPVSNVFAMLFPEMARAIVPSRGQTSPSDPGLNAYFRRWGGPLCSSDASIATNPWPLGPQGLRRRERAGAQANRLNRIGFAKR